MSALSLDKVTKLYGNNPVLKDISINIEAGEFLVLLGPSGCGKSTLLYAIAGLHSVSSGDIKIGDVRVNDVPCQDRNIAMVFQSYALYPSMTVEGNIAFPLEMRKIPVAMRKQAVADVARLLRIEQLLKRRPSQLSGGQRQRVAIGRALVRDPQLFLFDEPLSNLDALLRVEMRTELKKLHRQIGRTTVYVTHDQVEAMTLASRIAILNLGVLQQIGTPAEVYERPANLFVASFIGSPAITLIKGSLAEKANRIVFMPDNADGLPETLPVPSNPELRPGRTVTMGLRPEAFEVDPSVRDDPMAVRTRVDVALVEPTGPDTIIVFGLGGVEASGRVAAKSVANVGPLNIGFSTKNAIWFDSETQDLIC